MTLTKPAAYTPVAAPGSTLAVADHDAGLHQTDRSAIREIIDKLGLGTTAPATGYELAGTGAGTSAWRQTPACVVTNTAAQSIADSTVTAITFDTELVDTEAIHSTSVNTSRLTCVTAGRYMVTGSVQFASNATGQRQARILVNGTAQYINGPNPVSGNVTRATVAGIVDLAASDYVELAAFQSSGGALNVDTATNSPRLAMVRIG